MGNPIPVEDRIIPNQNCTPIHLRLYAKPSGFLIILHDYRPNRNFVPGGLLKGFTNRVRQRVTGINFGRGSLGKQIGFG